MNCGRTRRSRWQRRTDRGGGSRRGARSHRRSGRRLRGDRHLGNTDWWRLRRRTTNRGRERLQLEQRIELTNASRQAGLFADELLECVIYRLERRIRFATLELADVLAQLELRSFVASQLLFC